MTRNGGLKTAFHTEYIGWREKYDFEIFNECCEIKGEDSSKPAPNHMSGKT